jgi:3-carboxy-cis,cis-muconate cycloisomerase
VGENLSRQWFERLFRAEAMCRVFSDHSRLQGILDFESALARAQARLGVIPAKAASRITEQCCAGLYDLAALSQSTAIAGNPAIPTINELTRLVAAVDPSSAGYVHWGATSQDAMDTGLVLQVRHGLDLIEEDAQQLCIDLAKLAAQHKATLIAGRTWLQHAAPTTFGLKAAGWLDAVKRCRERFQAVRPRAMVVQLGGAVGALTSLGNDAEQTTGLLAEELGLCPALLPWHTQRDRLTEVAAALGLLVGALGKVAHDIALLTQSEIAEVAEPTAPGRGSSSSMPHKRNPVGCATVLAAAMRVPALVATLLASLPQEHERGLGGWQAEWETLPEIFLLSSGALVQMSAVIAGLRVDTQRMQVNLEATRGLIYADSVSTALARKVGHAAAHKLVERACHVAQETRRDLLAIVRDDADIARHLSVAEVQGLFDPEQHIRAAARLVDKALASE